MTPHAQARVVLCGGIGTGKSTVGRLLAERGALVIDADEVGHYVLGPEGAAFDSVATRWPDVVRDGIIDRSSLAAVVFGDPAELAALESMTHPAIRAEILDRVSQSSAHLIAVEVPLLSEMLGEGWLRVVVDVPDETRQQRLVDRGMSLQDIAQRMAAQPSRFDWLDVADIVIDNSGSEDDLEKEVERALEEMRGGVDDGANQ